MENTENVTIENYLKKIGFEEEDIESEHKINKLNLDQNTTYKLRVEDMNKMGKTESIKFIFKGNENIWRNRKRKRDSKSMESTGPYRWICTDDGISA